MILFDPVVISKSTITRVLRFENHPQGGQVCYPRASKPVIAKENRFLEFQKVST